jgi:hypothetical protein
LRQPGKGDLRVKPFVYIREAGGESRRKSGPILFSDRSEALRSSWDKPLR